MCALHRTSDELHDFYGDFELGCANVIIGNLVICVCAEAVLCIRDDGIKSTFKPILCASPVKSDSNFERQMCAR